MLEQEGAHTIVLDDDITPQRVESILERAQGVLREGVLPPIHIYFDCVGGDVPSGFTLYEFLARYPGHTAGWAMGTCESMAAIVLQGCRNRYSAYDATIMIHHFTDTSVPYEALLYDESPVLREIQRKARAFTSRQVDIITRRSGQDANAVYAQLARHERFTAQEALAFGLVDELI